MVKFVREPHNPYDRNAVRVENIRGEKLGHLRRELVLQLAALLDGGEVTIEGLMPGSGKSKFTLPIVVSRGGRLDESSSGRVVGKWGGRKLFAMVSLSCKRCW